MQNKIIKGTDNPVVFIFTFTGDFAPDGLTNFDRMVVTVGGETYSTDITPNQLSIVDANTLKLVIGDTTSLDNGYYTPTVTGFNATYNDGYTLNSVCNNALGTGITVC